MYTYEWVFGRREPIEFENVHEIIKLTMNITTHCELAVLRYSYINKRLLSFKQFCYIKQNLENKSLNYSSVDKKGYYLTILGRHISCGVSFDLCMLP